MSFLANDNQQLSLSDSTFNLTEREKRVLEKSWAKTFAERVFPAIDENIFSVFLCHKNSACHRTHFGKNFLRNYCLTATTLQQFPIKIKLSKGS